MDGGAWWAAVHGVAKSRTRLSDPKKKKCKKAKWLSEEALEIAEKRREAKSKRELI